MRNDDRLKAALEILNTLTDRAQQSENGEYQIGFIAILFLVLTPLIP